MEVITILNLIIFIAFIITLISDIIDNLTALYIFSFISLLFTSINDQSLFSELISTLAHPVLILLISLGIFSNSSKKSQILIIAIDKFNNLQSPTSFLIYLLLFTTILSALLNNALIVSSLIPLIMEVTKKNNWPIQNFLMPLSFSSMMGGTITTIGSSTNLVAISLLRPELTINILDMAKYAFPTAIIGVLYLIISRYIIQEDVSIPTCCDIKNKNTEVKLIFVRVEDGSNIIGKSVRDSQVQELYGLQLCGIQRGDTFTALPPRSYTIIEKLDILTLIGFRQKNRYDCIDDNIDNSYKNNNLTIISKNQLENISQPNVAIGLVAKYFSVIKNKKCSDIGFKQKYHSILLAIIRNNKIINRDLSNQTILANDFIIVHGINSSEDVVNKLQKICHKVTSLSGNIYRDSPNNKITDFLLILIFLGIIINGFFNYLDITILSLIGVSILLLSGSINIQDIHVSIKNYKNIILGTASSLLFSKCLNSSGVLLYFSIFTQSFNNLDNWSCFLFYHILASLLSILVSNVAVVSILIPIVKISYLDSPILKPICFSIIHGASCCFASPTGYHTNLMIHSIGNYCCKDYIKLGIPLHIITSITFATLLNYF